MICRNRPIRVLNRNSNDNFGSGGTVTEVIPCAAMERLSLHAAFTTAPSANPTVSFSDDGVNWDEVETIAPVPSSTTVYKAELATNGAGFVRLVFTAGPGGSDQARINCWLWPTPDPNQD